MLSPRTRLRVASLIAIVLLMACSHSYNDELPRVISQFVNQYYPNSAVSSYNENSEGDYYVAIRNGATMTFNSQQQWTSVNGNGVVIPSVFLFNELPLVYNYLEARDQQSDLLAIRRDARSIVMTFRDFMLKCTADQQDIHYVTADEVEE